MSAFDKAKNRFHYKAQSSLIYHMKKKDWKVTRIENYNIHTYLILFINNWTQKSKRHFSALGFNDVD